MFDKVLAINNILIGLEACLKLEASADMKTEETVNAAIERLENTYAVKFDTDVFTLAEENQLYMDQLSIFMRDLQQALCMLSFFTDLKLHHKNLAVTLSDVNYLGYTKQHLMTSLSYLQDADLYKLHVKEVMEPFMHTLNTIPMCTVKRLFHIMLVLYKLGVEEGVSCVARLLYIGGLVV